MPIPDVSAKIEQLLSDQPTGVLATYGKGQPYTSLVAFTASPDLKQILFATDRNTRKFANLQGTPRSALLIDDRAHLSSDFQRASAVTALGTAVELTADGRRAAAERFLEHHPALTAFVNNPACALMAMAVEEYLLVERFGMVRTFQP